LRTANVSAASGRFDELGLYRLIHAAHIDGTAAGFVREWLGTLVDYDVRRNSGLVLALSYYLECVGNYDESAAALRIHRSAELSGPRPPQAVDTRVNLHAATRAWRSLNPDDLSGYPLQRASTVSRCPTHAP
jgi:hypothetical protein